MGYINMLIRVYFVVLVVLAAALLVGCGGSSKTSSASTNASATTATTGAATTTGATGTETKGANGPRVGPFKRNGLAKPPVAKPPVTTPALKQALTKFATCLRQNGVNIAPPNTSGKGPILSVKGVNTGSAKFKAASTKCRSALLSAFHVQRGASKVGTTGATSGSTGQTKTSPVVKPAAKLVPKAARAFHEFVACMRKNGVTNFPEPEGTSFNLSHTHIDTKSAQYKAAEKKCTPILNAAF
jgi:hypothetical protein